MRGFLLASPLLQQPWPVKKSHVVPNFRGSWDCFGMETFLYINGNRNLFIKFIITILIRELSHSPPPHFSSSVEKFKESLPMTGALKCLNNLDILSLISTFPSMLVMQNEYILEICCTTLCLYLSWLYYIP